MNTEPETYLACLDDSYKFEDEAKVAAITTGEDGRTAVTLNRTIFYPQGGGQPADTGTIHSIDGKFSVTDVRLVDGRVFHYGTFLEGSFRPEETVVMHISKHRRMLNARLHSAGHLIDIAVQRLRLDLKPGKGYHFPDSPYVEYEGKLESTDREELCQRIQSEVHALVQENLPIKTVVTNSEIAGVLCGELPPYIDKARSIRVVSIGDYPGCPCGGTHLKELGDLGFMQISKIRTKADKVKINYILS